MKIIHSTCHQVKKDFALVHSKHFLQDKPATGSIAGATESTAAAAMLCIAVRLVCDSAKELGRSIRDSQLYLPSMPRVETEERTAYLMVYPAHCIGRHERCFFYLNGS